MTFLFRDAICNDTTWSDITRQDYKFFWRDYETYDTTHAIFQKNISLQYVREGIYGANMSITIFHPSETQDFSFENVIQIKPYDYLEEKKRTMLSEALNVMIVGLTTVAAAPVVIQLINSYEEYKESKENKQKGKPSESHELKIKRRQINKAANNEKGYGN